MIPHDAGLPESSGSLPFPKPREAGPAPRVEPLPAAFRAQAESPAPPGLAASPDIVALLGALRQRWAAAVLLGGTLAVITGVSVWVLLTPKNTAFAHLQVSYTVQPILDRAGGSLADFKAVLRTTADEIATPRVVASALRRDEVKRLGLDQKEASPAQAILDDLKVDPKENSEILTITYPHKDPVVATTLVNAIKDAYLQDIVPAKQAERAERVRQLQKVYDEGVDAIKTKRDSLKKIVSNLDTVDPKAWQLQRLELAGELKEKRQAASAVAYELIKARASLDALEAGLKAAKERAEGTGTPADQATFDAALEEAVEKDPEAMRLREQLRNVQHNIDDHITNRGVSSGHPAMNRYYNRAESLSQMLAARKQAIAERVKKALARAAMPMNASGQEPTLQRAQLQKHVEALAKLDAENTTQIKQLAAKVAATPLLGADYDQLAEEIRREEETLKTIGQTLDREKVEMRGAPRIRSFQDAELMKPEIKKQVLAAGASPIAVFGAVCMGLAWLEFRKRRVRSAGEISRGLGIRVVGAVPRMPHLERHLVGPTGESDLEGTPVMESIDAIRTRLLHEANTRSTRVVMVTSAGPGEGKTTLAAALATSLARAGRKTLLLDGDLRRPTVHELFEVAMQPGFSEVLLGEIEVAEAAQETPQENLSVIPAGQWDREVLLALSRNGLEGVFEKLAEEFDFVVVDSHPVLAATDSLLIGRQADAVLLSVLREVSQMPRVYAASQQLAAVGVRVLGAVVNGTDPEEVYTSPPVAAAAA